MGGHLPLPKWTATTRPGTIDVIGDTGCELPVNPAATAQHCATARPFKPIANSIARAAPDLVIHTGDYLYRDDPSRADDKATNPGCTLPTQAASWACVVADFFRPAEALLTAAPVALTRGNHEDCNAAQQGGAGGAWFRYLADELRGNGSCSRFPPPATIRAGTLNLASVDSSFADPSDTGSTAQANTYARQFEAVNNGTWDLTFQTTNGSMRGQICTLSTSLANKSFTCH
ncbi:metallophosphoesterase [Streptomyces avermitilis]|uniref:metallophosphoesterase n=1 Tax=Streptomyces avermitilis TaxID=33903 RepID=UPI0036C1343D